MLTPREKRASRQVARPLFSPIFFECPALPESSDVMFVVAPSSSHSAGRGGRAFAPAMASRRDALLWLLRGARSVSLAGTHRPAAASYATTSGWRAWKGYGEEKPARGGTRAPDRAAREERALNDLLVRSRHHERVLALVQNGVVTHDASDDAPNASADASMRNALSTSEKTKKKVTFRAANVATSFSRLRSALKRVPLGGPVNRRRELASNIVTRDARYANMREMLRKALPSFGPIELATTIKALADIHAFAQHGRTPALRLTRHDGDLKTDTDLSVLFKQCVKTHAHKCDTRRTIMLVEGLRGLGRVADRFADEDGFRAVASAIQNAAMSDVAHRGYRSETRSDTRNSFACLAWNLHYGNSWRSANRVKRNPEPLARATERLGNDVWRAVAEKIVFGKPAVLNGDQKERFRERDDSVYDDSVLPLSRRGLAMAMDAFVSSSELRLALNALDADTGGAARRELQAAVFRVAKETFREGWRSDATACEQRRRLLIGWGPTPARVAAGRAPTECLAIGAGCAVLGLEAIHEGFTDQPPAWVPDRGSRLERSRENARDVFLFDDEDEEDDEEDLLLDELRLEAYDDRMRSRADETRAAEVEAGAPALPSQGLLDVDNFRVAGGRLDLASLPPAPPKPTPRGDGWR